jgi:polysaccharide export outer membrane protein
MPNKAIGLAIGVSFLLFGGCATQETGTQGTYASVPGSSARVDYAARGPVDGAEVRGDIQESPLAPASPVGINRDGLEDYQIGPQDLLEINVFGVTELSGAMRVNSQGFISLPLIGQVKAAGLTSQQMEKQIEADLAKEYLQDPEVSVYVKEYTSQQVTVEGAINRPGIYELRGPTTLLQTIAIANGLAKLADSSDIKVFRQEPDGTKTAQSFDLNKIRSGETKDPLVRGNDVIVVQQSRSRSFLRDSLFRDITDLLNPFRALPY